VKFNAVFIHRIHFPATAKRIIRGRKSADLASRLKRFLTKRRESSTSRNLGPKRYVSSLRRGITGALVVWGHPSLLVRRTPCYERYENANTARLGIKSEIKIIIHISFFIYFTFVNSRAKAENYHYYYSSSQAKAGNFYLSLFFFNAKVVKKI
jgi:hypothetical protein